MTTQLQLINIIIIIIIIKFAKISAKASAFILAIWNWISYLYEMIVNFCNEHCHLPEDGILYLREKL